MIARSVSKSRTAGALRAGMSNQRRRVQFANDHPDLMKPRATDMYFFNKDGLVSEFVHEKTEPVRPRPRRLRFGKKRTLAEMAADSCPQHNAPQPTDLSPCAVEWNPRSIKVTTERVDPADILRSKIPASPPNNPMTALSNGKKQWEQMEMSALNKASRMHYQLIRERSQLVELIYQITGQKRNAALEKISQIDQQIQDLETEMNKRRHNMLSLQAF